MKSSSFISEESLHDIIKKKYDRCPKCGEDTLYAGCLEQVYDDEYEDYNVLSFNVFCENCGEPIDNWDKTNRQYWLNSRTK